MQTHDTQIDRCQSRILHPEGIARAVQFALPRNEVEGLAQLFKAMGDPNRIRILRALRNGEMCVCDLAAFLKVTDSAVSHQLRLLRTLHLVTNRREGPVLYYRLADDHVARLMELALEHVRE